MLKSEIRKIERNHECIWYHDHVGEENTKKLLASVECLLLDRHSFDYESLKPVTEDILAGLSLSLDDKKYWTAYRPRF